MGRIVCLLISVVLAQPYRVLEGLHQRAVNAIAFIQDGRYLLSAGSDGYVFLYDMQEQWVDTLLWFDTPILAMAVSPDETYLALGDSRGVLRVFELQNLEFLAEKQLYNKPIERVAFNPENPAQILSCSYEGKAILWEFRTDWELLVRRSERSLYAIGFAQNGDMLIGGSDRTLTLHDHYTGDVIRKHQLHRNTIRAISVAPHRKYFASGDLFGVVLLHDLPSFSIRSRIEDIQEPIRSLAFSPDGRFLAIATRMGNVYLWSVENQKVVRTLRHHGSLWDVAFSPDGKVLAIAENDGDIKLWRIERLGIQKPASQTLTIKPPVAVDFGIPSINKVFPNRYALIIGNEDYASYQTSFSPNMNVLFARADATVFKEYAVRRLGVPEEQCLLLLDAGATQMKQTINKLKALISTTEGAEVFVFYAGHGIPHPLTKAPLLLPVDVDPFAPEDAIALQDLINTLSSAQPKLLTLFIDACFSGGGRYESPLATRGVLVKPKTLEVPANTILFAATTKEETALPFPQAQHGLFTYFLLKALKEAEEPFTYQELVEKVSQEVLKYAILLHNREQHPTVLTRHPSWQTIPLW